MEQNQHTTSPSVFKIFWQFQWPQESAAATFWFTKKIVPATLLFLVCLATRLLEYYGLIVDETALHLTYAGIAVLLITALFPPIISLFHKAWLHHAPKIVLMTVSLGLFIFGLYNTWHHDNHAHLFSSAFLSYVLGLLVFLEQKLIFSTNNLNSFIQNKLPATAMKREGSRFVPTDTALLKKGDILRIDAGDTIPADGLIASGTTSIDDYPITGEFKPKLVGKGDLVVGGTTNRDSNITIEVLAPFENTIIQHIIKNTKHIPEDDFPPFRKATLFSLFFIFLGLFGGMALSFFQVIFHQLSWDVSLGYGLAFFLSFCLISYPGTIMISTHVIRKNLFNKGILVKKLSSLPKLADLDLLYLNKTGTLTQGTFVYAQHYLEQGSNQGQLLSTFFSLAAASHHPLAEALETHPWYHEITRHPVEELKEYPGLGVCGYINPSKGDHRFFAALGNLRFLKRMQMQVSRDMKNKIDDLEALGETVLLGGYDRFVRGVMSFADVLRTDIHSTLKEIQELQIEPAIITGDAEDDVSHLITELKLTKVYARCTPEEKAAKIEKDIADGKIVGFVGSQDYSLPFEKAHVSVSVDTGTQIIDQTADVLILGSRIRLLSWLLQQTQQLFSRNRTRLTTSVILSLLVATTSVLGITSAEFVVTFICLINILTLRSSAADAS